MWKYLDLGLSSTEYSIGHESDAHNTSFILHVEERVDLFMKDLITASKILIDDIKEISATKGSTHSQYINEDDADNDGKIIKNEQN